jgi:hypothetical protein
MAQPSEHGFEHHGERHGTEPTTYAQANATEPVSVEL